ncbi:MAG: ATP-binding protein, partial [Deltaproteobacteria bacterium]
AKAPVHSEEVVKHKDGDWHTYLTVKFPIYQDEAQPFGICAISSDITDRKRAQEEQAKLQTLLFQSQKLESIGRLAGGVAHDFNNMLAAILGNAELALARIDASSPIVSDLNEIRKAAEHSADLTRQLLTFARKQPITPEVVDLNLTVAEMIKVLRRLVGEQIEVTWAPADALGTARVDPMQLQQILTNLCLNARDAHARVIRIASGARQLDDAYCALHHELTTGEYLVLAVSDDGDGMDLATQGRLFEPFFTTKELGRGTGLGLSTILGIVEQNRGHIVVTSEPGEGTSFEVFLPRYGAAQVAAAAPSTPQVAAGHETILLVEDEPAVLRVTTRMLRQLGYQVLAATHPDQALRLAREHVGAIQLAMTDVVMPHMNGRELAILLRSVLPGIRCLFMSGYATEVLTHQGVLDEMVCFLRKPFTRAELARTVRQALDGPATGG